MTQQTAIIRAEHIEQAILLLRGQKVMLDRDLAALYGVETKNLNKAVRRNLDRFPADFMFQLTAEDADSLRFQFGTLKRGQHSKYLPTAFTEQGVAMLSSVLNSRRAIQVNVAIGAFFLSKRCGAMIICYLENREDELFDLIFTRADRVGTTAVGVRHFSDLACACKICAAHRRSTSPIVVSNSHFGRKTA